jgi:malate dehydrogenase (oxaloacetate-decarboxylating)
MQNKTHPPLRDISLTTKRLNDNEQQMNNERKKETLLNTQTSVTKRPLYIRYAGPILLETPLLNKGSAFSKEEREVFNLEGLLPEAIETIEEQVLRAYTQYSLFENDLDKHIYLRNIQDTNETLYYRLISTHLKKMMPIIYTPVVGEACQQFSKIYRRKRGLFLNYPDRERMDFALQNATKQNVKIIVVTDSERILGLGDQGIGGMGIPIGKLALYSACGGISPAHCLPVTLDVGTNNQALLDDPMYMGWRNKRIKGKAYFQFIDQFIIAVKERWPKAIVQFEDFSQDNAMPLLQTYKDKLCCFNDDIQGTACVTVGTLLAACFSKKIRLKDQTVLFVGAGSAGCGIANQIVSHMIDDGLSKESALNRVYLSNSRGLLIEGMEKIRDFQKPYVKSLLTLGLNDQIDSIPLLEAIKKVKPTILIGVSGRAGIIDENIIKAMFCHAKAPIIMPLSNPTSQAEAHPHDVIRWTDGQAMVATGSPFDDFQWKNKTYHFSQCNNAYIFPGIGLGVIASHSYRITNKMFIAASIALAESSPLAQGTGTHLLPPLEAIQRLSKTIALAVAKQAMMDGVAEPMNDDKLNHQIERTFWKPEYRHYRRCSF